MPKYTQPINAGPLTSIRENMPLALTGTTSPVTALSDGSDATYGKAASAYEPHDYQTAWPTLAAGERIVAVCPYVRAKQPGSKTTRAVVGHFSYIMHDDWRVYEGIGLSLPTYVGSAVTYEVFAQNGQQLDPAGGEWTPSGLSTNRPFLAFYDPHTSDANRTWWYEAGLHFYATKAATIAAPTTPANPTSTTQYPTITAVASALVEGWQAVIGLPTFMTGITVRYRVYSGSHTTPPAATPLADWTVRDTIANYIDGITPSTKAIASACPVALPNGAMTVFAQVSRDHPSGVLAWSAASYRQWTQSVPNPTAPTVTLGASTTYQEVAISITAPATAGYDSTTCVAEVQRLVGSVWREVRGMTEVPITVGGAVFLGTDEECAREVANTYRARVSMWHTADAVRRYSAWTQQNVTGPAFTGTGWNLKTLEKPSDTWVSAPVTGEPSEASQRATGTIEPLDRDRPIVTSAAVAGVGGALELSCSTAADIAALEALVDYAGLVYLETAFGDAKHIAIADIGWSRHGTRTTPRRVASLSYTEVSHGLEEFTA